MITNQKNYRKNPYNYREKPLDIITKITNIGVKLKLKKSFNIVIIRIFQFSYHLFPVRYNSHGIASGKKMIKNL
ncbi:hypothetical protein C1634_006010 [Chryseobacterium viscerum]|uniref:Uncharacterized protein n=1 Tax=Chryseobacterium viscerum TaxID=1037377 RepID=A0A316WUL9_9FLAO|nr:hypothetical protein C1634_006010 [Chryseobacterium viscerum]